MAVGGVVRPFSNAGGCVFRMAFASGCVFRFSPKVEKEWVRD